MKKNIVLILFMGFIALNATATQVAFFETFPVSDEANNMPNGFDKINLLGTLMLGVGPNAIEAGASDNAVYIGFNQSFGNVNISIYNSIGSLVYSTVVNTDVQQIFIIPFSGIASGTYTVELNNADGYAEGDFEHN